MTYRISTFLIGLLVMGGFALPAQAAEPKTVIVQLKPGEPAPACKARATKRHIKLGQQTTLVWSSKNADKMYGITKGGEWDADGRQNVSIAFTGKKKFTMTFVGEGGITTCEAIVHITPKPKK